MTALSFAQSDTYYRALVRNDVGTVPSAEARLDVVLGSSVVTVPQTVVSNSVGTVTSASATVTVSPIVVAPTITRQPQSLTLTLGANATFTVGATGTDLAYQWFDATGLLTTATTAILKTPIAGTYHVVVSNSAGSVRSNDVIFVALPLQLPLTTTQASP